MKRTRAVENKGCKQEVNFTLECGHVWTSWICNNWTACLTAGLNRERLGSVEDFTRYRVTVVVWVPQEREALVHFA